MRYVCLVCLLCLTPLLAQDSAPVELDGQVLWTVKAPRAAFSIRERAEDVRNNLIHFAEDRRRGMDEVREVQSENDTMLLISRVYIFAVTDDDARIEGKPRDALFAQRKQIALDAIRRYRESRSSTAMLKTGARVLGALLAALLALVILRLAYRRIVKASDGLFSLLSRGGHASAIYRLFEGSLKLVVGFALSALAWTTGAIIVFTAISFVLGLFPATAGLAGSALGVIGRVLRTVAGNFVDYLPNLLVLAIVSLLTYGLIRIAKALSAAVDSGAVSFPGFHREWASPTYDLVKILLVLFALVVAFPYLPGGESPALKGASIFIGVLVSLGSGSAMGNVIAGVILTYMRPFRVGDRIRIAETIGDVTERSLLVTRIRTIKNVEIIVPNSSVLGAHIINYSAHARDHGLILNTSVTIGYDAPWRTVHELMIAAALRTGHILPEPRPFVFQTSLNDWHVSYEINAFTSEANKMAAIYSELHTNIQEEFNAAGVEIMSPTFYALRDGNTVTIPENHRPANYVPPSFRVRAEG